MTKADNRTEAERFALPIDSTDGRGNVSPENKRILHLYAIGAIDYEKALITIKSNLDLN